MKSFILILLFFICAGLNAQKGNLTLSRWHLNDKVETSDFHLIKKSRLYYFISNDNDNIYIDLKVDDQGVQSRILKEGLTIWINMDDRPLKKMGVRYPTGSHGATLLSLANTIELIGFTNERERHFPSENADNFRGSVKYDEEGTLYYKMVMPIAKLPVRNSKDGNGAMPFTLGIEYGENLNPSSSSAYASGGTRESATGSSGSGGRRPGKVRGTPAGSMGRNSAIPQAAVGSELYWIKNVKLATSK